MNCPRGELQSEQASAVAWHGDSPRPKSVHRPQSISPVGSGSSGTSRCSRQQRPVPGGGGGGGGGEASTGGGGGSVVGQLAGCSSHQLKLPQAEHAADEAWQLRLGLLPYDTHVPHGASGG